jgi:hypothetical protein
MLSRYTEFPNLQQSFLSQFALQPLRILGYSTTINCDLLESREAPCEVSDMALIVAVHGIGQQFEGAPTLKLAWFPALLSGLHLAGGHLQDHEDFRIAFYGDLFRQSGKAVEPAYTAEDIADPLECDLLVAWAEKAAETDSNLQSLSDQGKARTPRLVQRALDILTQSKFFVGISERALIGDLKQVRLYMADQTKRQQIQDRLIACISDDTRIVIGHSLGSVVAYEVIAAHPEWKLEVFVTLGSPLGIHNIIFERLLPRPRGGVGAWPGQIKHWVNIADGGDVVALNKKLASLFGREITDHLIYNGATAHNVLPYLTAKETGQAMLLGLPG